MVNGSGVLRVLVMCEESQAVCREFRELGHEAYSNDMIDCSGEYPEWHIKGDARELMKIKWDLVIGHPPCTYLSNSGVRWLYNDDKSKNTDRWEKMAEGALFFKSLWNANARAVVLENPVMHKYAKEIIGLSQSQTIQPWQFGHGETKATCLWIKGVPNLVPTNIVPGREAKIHRMAPGPDRAKERSKTYIGIAQAMAIQWSNYLTQTPTL